MESDIGNEDVGSLLHFRLEIVTKITAFLTNYVIDLTLVILVLALDLSLIVKFKEMKALVDEND